MKAGFAGLFRAVTQPADLCEIRPDEQVIAYSDTRQNPTLAQAVRTE